VPDPLQTLLGTGAVPATAFPPTSRYHGAAVQTHDPGDGTPPVPYLARRLCPRPDRFSLLYVVTIAEGDRRDLLAARHSADPALWWQLADANGAVDPRTLTERPGATIDVTLPADVPGDAHA
jgi:hypothetical protein